MDARPKPARRCFVSEGSAAVVPGGWRASLGGRQESVTFKCVAELPCCLIPTNYVILGGEIISILQLICKY